MNQIEQTFKDNIDIGLDQLEKGIIDTFTTSIIPLPWAIDYIENKHQYKIYRSHIDPDYQYIFNYVKKNKQVYLSGFLLEGPVTIKFKNES